MAVLGTDQDDPNNPNGVGGNVSGGGAFAGSGSGQGATTSVKSAAPTSSGNFTNLMSYLNANQGSGTTTGQGVENVLNTAAQQATDSQNAFKNSAQGEIAAGGHNLDINQNTINAIDAGATNQIDPAKMAAIKSGQLSSTDAAYKGPNEQTAENASYSGPMSLTGFGGQTSAAQHTALTDTANANDLANTANSGFSGISSLLKSNYKQPSYTTGENRLDSFLVGGTSGGQQALAEGTANIGKANGNYDSLNSSLSGQMQDAQAKAKATNDTYDQAIKNNRAWSKNTQDYYTGAINDYNTTQQAAKDAQAKAAQAAAAAPAPTPELPTPPASGSSMAGMVEAEAKRFPTPGQQKQQQANAAAAADARNMLAHSGLPQMPVNLPVRTQTTMNGTVAGTKPVVAPSLAKQVADARNMLAHSGLPQIPVNLPAPPPQAPSQATPASYNNLLASLRNNPNKFLGF